MAVLNTTRQTLFIGMPQTKPPWWYVHEPPPEDASRPIMPDTLTLPEIAEVNDWLNFRIDSSVTLPNAIIKRDQFKVYFSSPAYNAWKVANHLAREMQWHWTRVDSAILNYPAVSPSSVVTGVGSAPPPGVIPKQEP